jgi:DNA/RNA-binding domain of Phe-tRNA-synthetase-like protein
VLSSVVTLAAVAFDEVAVVEHEPRLDAPLAEAEARVRLEPPAERAAVRAMYRAVGLDPTRRRPSSEALLRRVMGGAPLPRINALVDICNWCSLELQVPYGLYDADRIEGDVELRMGAAGEEYAGIRKDVVHVERRLTLADRLGPFGNPSADSARSMVTTATTRVLAVIYAPRELPSEFVHAALALTASRITEFGGGRETLRLVI